jgi:hypothetical protein
MPMSDTNSTHDDLWAGIDLKLGSATFHFLRMGDVLQPPKLTGHMVAIQSSGAVIGGNWHEAFYAHLDAFLSTTRSTPELIQCCFGVDRAGPKIMKDWFNSLDRGEQNRRRKFGDVFKTDYDAFRALPLGTARHISEHRTGVPPVTVTVTGRFGLTYSGGPTKMIPMAEAREMPPDLGWMQKFTPIQPMWKDFVIDGKPLFQACREYLESAQAIVVRARALAASIHGSSKLTSPPDEM